MTADLRSAWQLGKGLRANRSLLLSNSQAAPQEQPATDSCGGIAGKALLAPNRPGQSAPLPENDKGLDERPNARKSNGRPLASFNLLNPCLANREAETPHPLS